MAPRQPAIPDNAVQAVRHFNRFYTKRIGVLQGGMLDSPLSLTELRVLYEVAHRDRPTAAQIGQELGLDAGYLSRLLAKLTHQKLLRRERSSADARETLLSFTKEGRKTFRLLDSRSDQQVAVMLTKLTPAQQKQLLGAMHTIEDRLADKQSSPSAPYLLRTHQPGDMGWIVHRHGALYWQEYGYDERFEALVANVVGEFVENFDPKRERCWIAERDGEILGTIFLVKKSKTVCKLRLLLVEPAARGLGIGRRLIVECIRFARQAGYKKMILWTQSELKAARHLYKGAGFQLVGRQKHNSWGRTNLVAEVWELKLASAAFGATRANGNRSEN